MAKGYIPPNSIFQNLVLKSSPNTWFSTPNTIIIYKAYSINPSNTKFNIGDIISFYVSGTLYSCYITDAVDIIASLTLTVIFIGTTLSSSQSATSILFYKSGSYDSIESLNNAISGNSSRIIGSGNQITTDNSISSGELRPASIANALLHPRYVKFLSFQKSRIGIVSITSCKTF